MSKSTANDDWSSSSSDGNDGKDDIDDNDNDDDDDIDDNDDDDDDDDDDDGDSYDNYNEGSYHGSDSAKNMDYDDIYDGSNGNNLDYYDDYGTSDAASPVDGFRDEEASILNNNNKNNNKNKNNNNSSRSRSTSRRSSFVRSGSAQDFGSKMVNTSGWWEGREKMLAGAVLCWCCLCLIIIGVVLGVLLGGKNDDDGGNKRITGRPTPHPTLAPQPLPPSLITEKPVRTVIPEINATYSPTIHPTREPTFSPTISSVPTIVIPETLTIPADQDTYINLDGEYMGDENGKLTEFLVQHGPVKDEAVPDTIGLVSFPFLDGVVPAFQRLKDDNGNIDIDIDGNGNGNGNRPRAILRLFHVARQQRGDDTEADRRAGKIPAATYTILRIPQTRMAIQYLHGYFFQPPSDDTDGVVVGPTFEVALNATVVDVDVSDLLFGYEYEPGREEREQERLGNVRPGGRRDSQRDSQEHDQQSKPERRQKQPEPDQMLLMIQNRGAEQPHGGDKFYSTNSGNPPTLFIDYTGGDPADIAPIVTEKPAVEEILVQEKDDEDMEEESEDVDED